MMCLGAQRGDMMSATHNSNMMASPGSQDGLTCLMTLLNSLFLCAPAVLHMVPAINE